MSLTENQMKEFMLMEFGEHCPDFDDMCWTCVAWKIFGESGRIPDTDEVMRRANMNEFFDVLKIVRACCEISLAVMVSVTKPMDDGPSPPPHYYDLLRAEVEVSHSIDWLDRLIDGDDIDDESMDYLEDSHVSRVTCNG